MGLLAIPLALGCIPAFGMGLRLGVCMNFTVPLALLGLGLIWLSLRALLGGLPEAPSRDKHVGQPGCQA